MEEQPKKQHPMFKRIAIVAISLAVIAGIAVGTITLLNQFFPNESADSAVTLTPEQQAAKQASENLAAGQKSENTGDTAAAIAAYKEALASYQAAGDEAGIQGVQLKLQYLESLKQ